MNGVTPRSLQPKAAPSWLLLAAPLLAALRLCHLRLLWADEDYHLAAALNILHGKLPYRDFWYDKPPLSALYYLLIGAHSGWPLRLLDAGYVLLACFLMYRLARAWWGQSEARLAAFLLAFFFAFYLPSAVVSFAADALLLVPHLAAIYFAFQKRAVLAGLCCALAFTANAKGLFVLAVCALWLPGQLTNLLIGFASPLAALSVAAIASGVWTGYLEQVWRWGWIYTAGSPVGHPFSTGLVRTFDWLGFHAALAGGTLFAFLRFSRRERIKLGAWLLLSFAAVCLGTRFAPHYYLQLLPAMVLAGSRGLTLALREYKRAAGILLVASLAVPFARFGPRYFSLAYDNFAGRAPQWSDVVMDLDSQQAARWIHTRAQPGDTLFVWGYRPDVYVYTRLTSDSRYWDSQPLTGVPADRHLQVKDPIYGGAAAQNRRELIRSKPTWIVDGLGVLNPRLAPRSFPDLRLWLENYEVVARTRLSIIYHARKEL